MFRVHAKIHFGNHNIITTICIYAVCIKIKIKMYYYCFQLSELEKRVLEAETRAVEAEGKVSCAVKLD